MRHQSKLLKSQPIIEEAERSNTEGTIDEVVDPCWGLVTSLRISSFGSC